MYMRTLTRNIEKRDCVDISIASKVQIPPPHQASRDFSALCMSNCLGRFKLNKFNQSNTMVMQKTRSIVEKIATGGLESALRHLNLKKNPFEVFELFSEGLSEEELKKHETIFQNRETISSLLLNAIRTRRSFKVVLHGMAGVGKSSILNLVLYILRRERRYLAFKLNINDDLIKNPNLLIKELLGHFGGTILDDALKAEGIMERLQAIVKRRKERRELRQIALLALLYSNERLSFESGSGGLIRAKLTIGIKPLEFEVTAEDADQVKIVAEQTRIPGTLLSEVLNGAFDLIQELGYEGAVIGIDDADKLTEEGLERALMSILKSLFYPQAKYHLIVVMAERDGRKKILSDIFTYEYVRPFLKDDFMKALEALYKSQAINLNKPLTEIFESSVLEIIYQRSEGKLRDAILDCGRCIDAACGLGKTQIDLNTYEISLASDEIQAYIKSLDRDDPHMKIIRFLYERGPTYTRNKALQTYVGVSAGRVSQIFNELNQRKIVSKTKMGRKVIYRLDLATMDVIRKGSYV